MNTYHRHQGTKYFFIQIIGLLLLLVGPWYGLAKIKISKFRQHQTREPSCNPGNFVLNWIKCPYVCHANDSVKFEVGPSNKAGKCQCKSSSRQNEPRQSKEVTKHIGANKILNSQSKSEVNKKQSEQKTTVSTANGANLIFQTGNNATQPPLSNKSEEETDYLAISGSTETVDIIYLKNDSKTLECAGIEKNLVPFSAIKTGHFIGAVVLTFNKTLTVCGGKTALGTVRLESNMCFMWKSGLDLLIPFANLSRSLSDGIFFPISKTSFGIAGGKSDADKGAKHGLNSMDIYEDGHFRLEENVLPWNGTKRSFCSAYMEEHDFVYFIGADRGRGFFEVNRRTIVSNILPLDPSLFGKARISCALYFSHESGTLKFLATKLVGHEYTSTVLDLLTGVWSTSKHSFKVRSVKKFIFVYYVRWAGQFLAFQPGSTSFLELKVDLSTHKVRPDNLYSVRFAMWHPVFISREVADEACSRPPRPTTTPWTTMDKKSKRDALKREKALAKKKEREARKAKNKAEKKKIKKSKK